MTSEDTGFPPDESGSRLAEALAGVDPFLSATPEDVADDLQRAFKTARVASRSAFPDALMTRFPAEAAEAAMNMVRPVLEAKDAEIARLREQVEKLMAAMASGDFIACRVEAANELEAGACAPVDTENTEGRNEH